MSFYYWVLFCRHMVWFGDFLLFLSGDPLKISQVGWGSSRCSIRSNRGSGRATRGHSQSCPDATLALSWLWANGLFKKTNFLSISSSPHFALFSLPSVCSLSQMCLNTVLSLSSSCSSSDLKLLDLIQTGICFFQIMFNQMHFFYLCNKFAKATV